MGLDAQAFPHLLLLSNPNALGRGEYDALAKALEGRGVGLAFLCTPLLKRRVFITMLQRALLGGSVTSPFMGAVLMKTHVAHRLLAGARGGRWTTWPQLGILALADGVRVVGVSTDAEAPGLEAPYWSTLSIILRSWVRYRWREALTYAMVGSTGALVILLGTWSLVTFGHLFYVGAAAIAMEVSIFWAFFLNDRWTFRRLRPHRSIPLRLMSFNLVSLGGVGINLLLLFVLTHFLGIFYLLSEVLAILGTFAFNYLTNIRFTWAGIRLPGSRGM